MFTLPPEITIEFPCTDCPTCKVKLFFFKSKSRTIVTIATGSIQIREIIRCCSSCGGRFRSDCIEKRVSPNCKFGFDVIARIGTEMFLNYRTDREIVTILREENIKISRSQVAELGNQYIGYLALLHKKRLPQIQELLFFHGKYILHVDGTNAGAGSHLIAAMDGIKEIVLGGVKTRSENILELIPFLERIKNDYGIPLAAVHDMSAAIITAIETVFPDIIDLICHFHFGRDVGKDLINDDYMCLKGILDSYKIEPSLKKMLKEMREMIKVLKKEDDLETYLKSHLDGKSTQLKSPLLLGYKLTNWILDYESESNGYGFPFDRTLCTFCSRLQEVQVLLRKLPEEMRQNGYLKQLEICIDAVLGDYQFCSTLSNLQKLIGYFEQLREALRIAPLDGKNGLNDNGGQVEMQSIKKQVEVFVDSKDIQKAALIDDRVEKMLKQIKKYWSKLFADPISIITKTGEKVYVYPQRTNNILEQLFRYLLRVHCKRSGYSKMSRYLQAVIADTPMIKNLLNDEYMKVLLGDRTMAEHFAEIDKDLVKEVVRGNEHDDGMSADMKKVLRGPDFLINCLAG